MIDTECIVAKIDKQNVIGAALDPNGDEQYVGAHSGTVELTLVAPGVVVTAKVHKDQAVMLDDRYSVTITKKGPA